MAIEFHFERVIGAVGLYLLRRKREEINEFGWLGKALQSALQIVVVMKEGAAGSHGEFGHDVFVEIHFIGVILSMEAGDEVLRGGAAALAGVHFGGVEAASIQRADGDAGARGAVHE